MGSYAAPVLSSEGVVGPIASLTIIISSNIKSVISTAHVVTIVVVIDVTIIVIVVSTVRLQAKFVPLSHQDMHLRLSLWKRENSLPRKRSILNQLPLDALFTFLSA